MLQRGIRGAITLEKNDAQDIEEATVELIQKLLDDNQIKSEQISHVIFTLTNDLTAAFPAKFARIHFRWDFVPMMCFNELNIDGALGKCLRVLIVVNTDKKQDEIVHAYLKDAKKLRPDLL